MREHSRRMPAFLQVLSLLVVPGASAQSVSAPAVVPSSIGGLAGQAASATSVVLPQGISGSLSPYLASELPLQPSGLMAVPPGDASVIPDIGPAAPLAVLAARNEAPPAAAGKAAAKQVITAAAKDGIVHPLAYDPAAGRESFGRMVLRTARNLPEKVRRIRLYMRRVRELVEGVTDDELWWSLSRLGELKSQEGILRSDNSHLVNRWKYRGPYMKQLSHLDFRESSLDGPSLVRVFKTGMDNEAPTLHYQFTSAHNLHNHMPRVSHFMGWTMQEYILAVALKGKQGLQSIWSNEEIRHGPILEAVYNRVREPDRPPLEQQGIASKEPVTSAYSARSMMANRALAEFAAAAAYLLIKANSVKDSPTDLVLDGIYRDEVYHKVIMEAVNMFVYGQRSRWHRIAMILRHSFDYMKPAPNDRVIYDRRFPSPLLGFEILYAFNALDKRVARYLKTLSQDAVMELIGEVYPSDRDVQDAVARGVHTWTPAFTTIQNPEIFMAEARDMQRRFPGEYRLEERAIRASDVTEAILTYRERSLTNPKYWMRKKGFQEAWSGAGNTHLLRPLEGPARGYLELEFVGLQGNNAREVHVSVWEAVGEGADPKLVFQSDLKDLSMLQIGALMDAEGAGVAAELEAKREDLSIEELVKRLNNSPGYQREPLTVLPN